MPQQIQQVLTECGMSELEARVYTANLATGPARASEIAKKSRLLRTTTYEILKLLVRKGYVTSILHSGVTQFDAVEPKRILGKLDEQKEKITSILPQLESMHKKPVNTSSVRMFEGKSGIKALLEDVLIQNPDDLLQLSSARIFEVFSIYFPQWIKLRVKAGIRTKTLQEEAKTVQLLKLSDKAELRETRLLPHPFKISARTHIYGDNVAIATLRKDTPFGIIIHDKDIAETYRSIFNELWKNSK